ncbi:alkaline phosphatase family protein [Caulobacter segnis]|uniref:alkaline phosphatase family protein n=1 Tax=Caulobacter segnis TaxID=88688 RepID=UPI0024104DB0|nr:alkaline phosphatase family protein [Caulobacter segnis]MDG2523122.1 alkaline phosphatase family protein [Caulobacter segnis]
MKLKSNLVRGLALAAAVAAPTLAVATGGHAAEAKKPAPKLVVMIIVDQFSANLFNQQRATFTGGLKTLAGGMVYANGFQSHAITETCAGHSTVLTGKRPNKTGIPANDWVDRATGQEVYCLAVPQNTLADGGPGENGRVGASAMRVSNLADWLKASSPGSRAFAVSGKDRGAINLAGQKGDGAFWYLDNFGWTTFVEPGQDAAKRLAPVAALNAEIKQRQLPAWTYTHDACRKLEADWKIGDRMWSSKVPPENSEFDTSPGLDDLTVEAAIRLLDEQKLGQGKSTDLLGVSLSATDRIGHMYGTQGPEMCEQMYRLDAVLDVLLKRLEKVPGGVVVALTADHGGSDFPERSNARGFREAGRLDADFLKRVNAEVRSKLGLDFDPVATGSSGFMIVDKAGKGLAEPQRSQVADVALEVLRKQPIVAEAHRLETAIAAAPPPVGTDPEEYTMLQRMHFSAVANRSADIMLAFKPGITAFPARYGRSLSSHGSPWDYDRRVPILFWWPGVEGQERFFPIETVDIGPTLANVVGATPPADIDGRCIDLGVFDAKACPKR